MVIRGSIIRHVPQLSTPKTNPQYPPPTILRFPNSMSRHFDYKKPSPTPQQVEALIERYAKFSGITEEDHYYISLDPTRRDKALADLQRAHPQQIPDGTSFAALFPSTEDSESFIAGVEQEIEKFTAKGEAMTFEECVCKPV